VTLGIGRQSYPDLHRHYDRMMARPAVQRTLATEAAAGYNLSPDFPSGGNR